MNNLKTQQALKAWRIVSVIALTVFLLSSRSAIAQQQHTVDGMYPQVGQLGTSVEVTVKGAFLEHPEQVLFYNSPGIRCSGFGKATAEHIYDNPAARPREPKPGQDITMTLVIAKDARVGEHRLRIKTRDNLSEVMTFWVTRFPVIREANPFVDKVELDDPKTRNDLLKYAQPIPNNCTVSGYKAKGSAQDHDWYRLQSKKGQRLTVEVVASRLGTWNYGGMNDPSISIHGPDGKELARNDDNSMFTQDPVVSIIAPQDGTYYIHMRQQMDYENLLCHYLMHVGVFARPMVLFPLGGQAGKTVKFEMLGTALDKELIEVKLKNDVGDFEAAYQNVFYRADGAPSPPSPNRVHVSKLPDVFEAGKHNSPESAQEITGQLPLAINGRIESEGEVDWYRFAAKKGDRYRVRIFGKTLDSDLDGRVFIRPAPGNKSNRSWDEDDSNWEPHDLVGNRQRWQIKDRMDPIFMFEPDQDGEWLIGIADTQRKFGPRNVYRVEIQPHVDSVFVHFPAYPSSQMIVRDRIVLFPGRSYSRPVAIQKGFGSKYSKPLQLKALNLPHGLTMDAPAFTQNDRLIPVQFTASKDVDPTKVGAVTVDLVVEPVEPKDRANFRGGFVQVTPATNRRGDFAMCFNRTRKMSLAVVKGASFDLRINPPSVPLVQNGELQLDVEVERSPGFEGDVYCEMDWVPNGVTKQPPLIIPAGQTSGTYKLGARANAKFGKYPISICGREVEPGNVRTGAGFHFVSSPFVTLEVSDPYVNVKLVRTAIERGKVGSITAEIEHLKKFNGTAELQLGRLPFGTKQVAPFPKIKPGQKTVSIPVQVTADCLTGQYKDIFCEVIVDEGDQKIRQQSGSGILRVDTERK